MHSHPGGSSHEACSHEEDAEQRSEDRMRFADRLASFGLGGGHLHLLEPRRFRAQPGNPASHLD